MENFHWKAIIIALVLLVFAIFFKDVVEFFTFVVTDFVETVIDIIEGGLTGKRGVKPVVRFCLTVIIIFGLIRLFKR